MRRSFLKARSPKPRSADQSAATRTKRRADPNARRRHPLAIAQRGTSGASEALPFLAPIQQSFGPRHRLSAIKAHVGGPAREATRDLGAAAYASGERIAFAQPPDLRLAAHEAAHVVQQRQGLELAGGIGRPGDRYERNAEEVAERVVRGESAAALLPTSGSDRSAKGDLVQRYTKVKGKPYNRVSDDGRMAVRHETRDAWAERSLVRSSNAVLRRNGSIGKIITNGHLIIPIPGKKTRRRLEKLKMVHWKSGKTLNLTRDCGTAAQELLGAKKPGSGSFVGITRGGWRTKAWIYDGGDQYPGGLLTTTERISSEIYRRIFRRELKRNLSRLAALRAWSRLKRRQKNRLSKKYGIEQFAVPKVGQGITIGSERDMPGGDHKGYNFHFGTNIMASGQDYLTVENYTNCMYRYYFGLYGPASKGQAWSQDPEITDDLSAKSTTMVVELGKGSRRGPRRPPRAIPRPPRKQSRPAKR